jgi:hypothetical protein
MPAREGARKQFFFEKKNQKTLICFGRQLYLPWSPVAAGNGAKVFWFFFSKKNCFLAGPPYQILHEFIL